MSDSAKPEPHPFEKLKEAMRHIITVPKEEILRREANYKDQQKARKRKATQ
jgi:hypothetical protein